MTCLSGIQAEGYKPIKRVKWPGAQKATITISDVYFTGKCRVSQIPDMGHSSSSSHFMQ